MCEWVCAGNRELEIGKYQIAYSLLIIDCEHFVSSVDMHPVSQVKH